MATKHYTDAALAQLGRRGYIEVTERGPRGSGKTSRVEAHYPGRHRILVEEGGDFETWLVEPDWRME